MIKTVGILTSGGDAPGMNAAIRAITKASMHYGLTPIGIKDGFEGLMNGRFLEMKYADVDNIIQRGGTILGSARCPEFKHKDSRKIAIEHIKNKGIDSLVVIGGDGSFRGAFALSEEADIPIIGLPATIDNDLYGTDESIGFDTALNTIISSIDNIRNTAYSHKRIFFVEVMGRDSGFLALNSAIASGAESVLIPESMSDLPDLAEKIKTQNKGRRGSIIIVAEGDEEGGAVDIKRKIQPYLEGFDLRATILGHIQRGGTPSYFDRSLATRSGLKAVELLIEGKSELMVGLCDGKIKDIPLKDAIQKKAVLDLSKEEILDKLLTKRNDS